MNEIIATAILQLGTDIIEASHHLGLGDSATKGWGAIEESSHHIGKSLDRIAESGHAIAEALESISAAITLTDL